MGNNFGDFFKGGTFSANSGGNGGYSITFKIFSMVDYPNGDNRIFTIQGAHTLAEVLNKIQEKYSYMGQVIPVYKDRENCIITIDSNDIYDKILYETFRDTSSKEGEIRIFIKPLNGNFNQQRFNRVESRGKSIINAQRNNVRTAGDGSSSLTPITLWCPCAAVPAIMRPKDGTSKLTP